MRRLKKLLDILCFHTIIISLCFNSAQSLVVNTNQHTLIVEYGRAAGTTCSRSIVAEVKF